MGLWAARWARLAIADESTPPERKTASGTSLARWSLSPSCKNGGQAVLVHGRIGGAIGDAPEVLLADLLAGAVKLEQPARPEELDAFDRGTRADHEAVPHTAGDGLRIEARRAQQPGGQQGTKL